MHRRQSCDRRRRRLEVAFVDKEDDNAGALESVALVLAKHKLMVLMKAKAATRIFMVMMK